MQATSRVRAVAARLFGRQTAGAVELLLRYGAGPEAERVHLAVLELSDGDLDKLERAVEVARTDFRDVVSPAEYPRQDRLGFPKGLVSRIRWRIAGWLDARQHAAWQRQFSLPGPDQ